MIKKINLLVGLGVTIMLLVACSVTNPAMSIDNNSPTAEVAAKNYVNAVYTNNIDAIISMLFDGRKHKIYYNLNKQSFRNYDKNDNNKMFALQPENILLHRIQRDLVEIKKNINQNGGVKKITLDKMYASISIMQSVKKNKQLVKFETIPLIKDQDKWTFDNEDKNADRKVLKQILTACTNICTLEQIAEKYAQKLFTGDDQTMDITLYAEPMFTIWFNNSSKEAKEHFRLLKTDAGWKVMR